MHFPSSASVREAVAPAFSPASFADLSVMPATFRLLLRAAMLTSVLAMTACGSGSSSTSTATVPGSPDTNPGGGNPTNPGGGASTAIRLAGFQAPGISTVQDASNTTAASCQRKANLGGGRHYAVSLTSASNQTIVFEVIEPKVINCLVGNPIVFHGPGFGSARVEDPTGTFLERLQNNGYAVVSIDQRGFHDSTGTVRVMDPNFEGRDLVQVLDWVEAHLDYLSHDQQTDGSYNLVAGSTGGSYGGMYQLLMQNMDTKHRLDAMTPDITPNDLRYSLNPNGVVKTDWALLLTVGGETGANQPLIGGLDPVIKETLIRGAATNVFPAGALPFFYYHSAKYFLDAKPAAEQDPISFLTQPLSGDVGYDFPAVKPKPIAILFSQGFRDTLFNFNNGWANFNGYKALGGDVRLMTHESGHILPGTQTVLGQLGPLDAAVGQITSALQGAGITVPEIQAPAGPAICGDLSVEDADLAFLNEKLQPPAAIAVTSAIQAEVNHLKTAVCVSLAPGKAAWVAFDQIDNKNRVTTPIPATTIPVPNSVLGITSLIAPTFIPLTALPGQQTLAGIGALDVTLNIPLLPLNGCALTAAIPAEIPLHGCDAIIYVGWGARKGTAAPRLLDEQVTPIRGLGEHKLDMTGIAEALTDGEQLGLLVYGFQLQYLSSISRDLLVPAVTLTGTVQVPLLAAPAP